jgi:hypothetical protein
LALNDSEDLQIPSGFKRLSVRVEDFGITPKRRKARIFLMGSLGGLVGTTMAILHSRPNLRLGGPLGIGLQTGGFGSGILFGILLENRSRSRFLSRIREFLGGQGAQEASKFTLVTHDEGKNDELYRPSRSQREDARALFFMPGTPEALGMSLVLSSK